MIGRNRNDRNDAQSYNRNAGYENRFGGSGMKGGHRYAEFEPESYGSQQRFGDEPMNPRRPAHGDYSAFEGTTNRPYYGGEEGSFPYGSPNNDNQRRSSYNADERNYSGRWMGEHAGKGPKGYRRSDERIREEVCEMLMEHGEIDASEVEVNVKEAVVELTGTVESRRIKRMAEDLVERINGVRDVRNDLRIMAHGISSEMVSDMAGTRGADENKAQAAAASSTSSQSSPRSISKDRASRTKGTKSASNRQISQ